MSNELCIESEVSLKIRVVSTVDKRHIEFINLNGVKVDEIGNLIRFEDPDKSRKEDLIRDDIKQNIEKGAKKSQPVLGIFNALFDSINDLSQREDLESKSAEIEIHLEKNCHLSILGNKIELSVDDALLDIDVRGNKVDIDVSQDSMLQGVIQANNLNLSGVGLKINERLNVKSNNVYFSIENFFDQANLSFKVNKNNVNYPFRDDVVGHPTIYIKSNKANGYIK